VRGAGGLLGWCDKADAFCICQTWRTDNEPSLQVAGIEPTLYERSILYYTPESSERLYQTYDFAIRGPNSVLYRRTTPLSDLAHM
jgi:hypothetical protein